MVGTEWVSIIRTVGWGGEPIMMGLQEHNDHPMASENRIVRIRLIIRMAPFEKRQPVLDWL